MLEPHACRAGRAAAPPCRPRGRAPRPLAALGLSAALLLPTAALAGETAAAREQARLCERLSGEEAVAACRSALALGIGPARRGPVRELLARQLVALERWDEFAELFRDAVRQDPADAVAWQRLGAALLFALDAPAEALGALQEAVRLAPRDTAARVSLGLALAANGRPPEAAAALEEALRLDASALDGRPAARAVLEAARQGRAWP
jgi:tetratricopeptide (TPR) repeat protein